MKGTRIVLNSLHKLIKLMIKSHLVLMINSHLVEECPVIHFKILLTVILIIKINKIISKFMINQKKIHSIIKDKNVIIRRVILIIIKK